MKVYDVLMDGEPLTRTRLVEALTVPGDDGPVLDRGRLGIVDGVCQFDVAEGLLDVSVALLLYGTLCWALPERSFRAVARQAPRVELRFT